MDLRMHWSPQLEEEIFHAAVELSSPKERAAYVHQACEGDAALEEHLNRLLAHSEVGDDLLSPVPDFVAISPTTSEGPGTIIGRYKLLEQIGEGGMGVVYMAEQEQPVRRRVALKIIKLGMDTKRVVARFKPWR
jgi:serine/threonine protein kinase